MNANRRTVVQLGFVSFFNDISSEVMGRILPLYLTVVVGSSVIGVGVVEAISEATNVFARILSGHLSDRYQRRKPWVFGGYALSVISRPFIVLFPGVFMAALARFFDRVGKGIRTSPRDALIADLSDETNRGYNFGIGRFLDSMGAVFGLACVALVLQSFGQDEKAGLTLIVTLAAAIGFLALLVLIFIKEPQSQRKVTKRVKLSFSQLDIRVKRYLLVTLVLSLAMSSDAFLVLRMHELGFSIPQISLVFLTFNLIVAISALYLGKRSDTFGRKELLVIGWIIYVIVYLALGFQLSDGALILTVLFYGFFYGFTEGVEKALIADLAPSESRGQTFGWLGLVQGLGLLMANLMFATIYYNLGPSVAFWTSSVLALIGVILLHRFNLKPQ